MLAILFISLVLLSLWVLFPIRLSKASHWQLSAPTLNQSNPWLLSDTIKLECAKGASPGIIGLPPHWRYRVDGNYLQIFKHGAQKRPLALAQVPTADDWKMPGAGAYPDGLYFECYCLQGKDSSSDTVAHWLLPEQVADGWTMHLQISEDDMTDPQKGIGVVGQRRSKKRSWREFMIQEPLQKAYLPANYLKRGPRWTRYARVSLFANRKTLISGDTATWRVHGNISRANPQKSWKLHFKMPVAAAYASPHFPEMAFKAQHWWLSAAGNDHIYTRMLDVFVHKVGRSFSVGQLPSQSMVLYFNGAYWGQYWLRPLSRRQTWQALFPDEKVHAYVNWDIHTPKIDADSAQTLAALLSIEQLRQAKAKPEILAQVDTSSLIDYLIIYTFFANADWPNNNVRLLRKSHCNSDIVKWYFLLHDFDESMGNGASHLQYNAFDALNNGTATWLVFYRGLMSNTRLRQLFIQRYREVLNTLLTADKTLAIWRMMILDLEPYMAAHCARWPSSLSQASWKENVEKVEHFLKHRPNIVLEQLKKIEAQSAASQ